MKLNKKEIFKRLCHKDDIKGLIEECKKQGLVKNNKVLNSEWLINKGKLQPKKGYNSDREYYEECFGKTEITDDVSFDWIMQNESLSDYKKASILIKDFTHRKEPVCCGKKIEKDDFDVAIGYWSPDFRPVHKGCKKRWEQEEAYACQKIDANCNDCKFFKRDISAKIVDVPKEYQDNIKHKFLFPPIQGYKGKCEKFNVDVYANAKVATGMDCFIHRKD